MKRFSILAITIVAALVAVACGSAELDSDAGSSSSSTIPDGSSTPPAEITIREVRLDIDRATVSPDDEAIAAVVRGDAALGLDVFAAVAGDDNVMVSPYSIASALSMLHAGAGGATAEQMADVLHLEIDPTALHEVRNVIEASLSAEPRPPTEDDERAPFQLRPANSVWGQQGYPFSSDYLTTLAQHYGAGLRVLDFVSDPEGSRRLINEWVEDTTEDRIRDLIPDGTIDPLTRLVLVNAIWFKANWAEQFNEAATADGTFTRPDGSTVDVPFLNGSQPAQFASEDGYIAVRLPFAGDAAMVFALPDAGSSPVELARALGPDLIERWEPRSVNLTIPKFEFESDIDLGRVLQELGMVAAFDPVAADLDAITDEPNDLYVSDALHKSFIAVDESGAEAAAATAIVVRATSAGPEPATFVADRPFLFWIEHTPTGEPLFLGQVTDPGQ